MNSISVGVRIDGTATDTWALLTVLHNAESDLGLLYVEEQLSSPKYTNSTNIKVHFKVMRTAWAKTNNQGTGINDKCSHTYIIKSTETLTTQVGQ